MKILFTVHRYYPQTGGVEIVTKYLAEGLAKLGHNVSVVTTKNQESPQQESVNGVNIYRFDIKKVKLLGYVGEKEKYINFIKTFDCDIIINECTESVTTDLLLKHLKDIKAKKILHAHGAHGLCIKFFANNGTIKNIIGNMYQYISGKKYFAKFHKYINNYDKIIGLSEVDKLLEYAKKYVPKSKLEILENAADEMFFDNKNGNKNNIYKYLDFINDNYMISVANYVAVKNQKLIMKAFYEANIKNYSLVFIGSQKTDYYEQLQKCKVRLEREYGNKDVHLLIGVERKDIPNILSNANIYIVGSISEQYSISMIEAMSQGVPFISTNVGNARILPGGKIVNNNKEMKKEMENLTNNKEEIQKLAKLGKEYAYNHCRINVAVNKLNNIISKME